MPENVINSNYYDNDQLQTFINKPLPTDVIIPNYS